MRPDRRGISLLEVLVACGLALLIMSVITALVRTGFQSVHQGESRASSFRLASNAMVRMENETRNCLRVYSPEQAVLESGFHLAGGAFVFARAQADGSTTVLGYSIGADHCLQRTEYAADHAAADYVPADHAAADHAAGGSDPIPLQPGSVRTMNRDFQDVLLQYHRDDTQNELVQMTMTTTSNDSIQTTVRLIGGFVSASPLPAADLVGSNLVGSNLVGSRDGEVP